MSMNSGDAGLEEEFLDAGLWGFLKSDIVEEPINNNVLESSKWAEEAMKLMARGELKKSLDLLNLCLPENQMTLNNGRPVPENLHTDYTISEAEEINLLEKRCLVLMKLKLYDKVWDDARRLLEKKPSHSLAFKCLLAALCKKNQVRYF